MGVQRCVLGRGGVVIFCCLLIIWLLKEIQTMESVKESSVTLPHTTTKHANTHPTCTHLPYLLGAKFAGLGQGHACGMRALQEVPVGGLVALDGWRPVVVGVLGVPCVGPPFQLVPQPLHCPRPLTLQVPVTLQDRETHTITKSAYDYLFPSIAILNPENMISFF